MRGRKAEVLTWPGFRAHASAQVAGLRRGRAWPAMSVIGTVVGDLRRCCHLPDRLRSCWRQRDARGDSSSSRQITIRRRLRNFWPRSSARSHRCVFCPRSLEEGDQPLGWLPLAIQALQLHSRWLYLKGRMGEASSIFDGLPSGGRFGYILPRDHSRYGADGQDPPTSRGRRLGHPRDYSSD